MTTSKKRLASTVVVQDEEHGATQFGPDDDVPAWAAKQITNEKAWAKDDDEDEGKAATVTPEVDAVTKDGSLPGGAEQLREADAKAGKGRS
jgi:hypothetical protein